jgi:hypothetical protein
MDWTARVRFPAVQGFSLLHSVQPVSGVPQPPIQWVPGTPSSVVKLSEREADHSPPSSAEVKNCGAIPPLYPMSSWPSSYLINNKDRFILLYPQTYTSCGAWNILYSVTIYLNQHMYIRLWSCFAKTCRKYVYLWKRGLTCVRTNNLRKCIFTRVYYTDTSSAQ